MWIILSIILFLSPSDEKCNHIDQLDFYDNIRVISGKITSYDKSNREIKALFEDKHNVVYLDFYLADKGSFDKEIE